MTWKQTKLFLSATLCHRCKKRLEIGDTAFISVERRRAFCGPCKDRQDEDDYWKDKEAWGERAFS